MADLRCSSCGVTLPQDAAFCLKCGGRVPGTPVVEPADPLLAALKRALGAQYDIIRLLGRGGMGAVYLARERALDRLVAVKVLQPESSDEDSVERFRREARTAAKLNHPGIVPLHSFGEAEGMMYFVMGFVQGEPLSAKLRRLGAGPFLLRGSLPHARSPVVGPRAERGGHHHDGRTGEQLGHLPADSPRGAAPDGRESRYGARLECGRATRAVADQPHHHRSGILSAGWTLGRTMVVGDRRRGIVTNTGDHPHHRPDLARERRRPGPGGLDRITRVFMGVCVAAELVVTCLDVGRFHSSDRVPAAVHALGLGLSTAGFALLGWAVTVNRFFSSVVRIQADRGHQIISAGPYRHVRHPGYLGMLLGYPTFSLAIGSWWGLVPGAAVVLVVLRRLRIEDAYLRANLQGYPEYAALVRYRLIPALW